MTKTQHLIPTSEGVLYKAPYGYSVGVQAYPDTEQHPSIVIGFDVPVEIDCIDVPEIVSAEGFYKYALGHKRISVVRFYCKHISGATPSGDGSKENPWNNFFAGLKKIHQFGSSLCEQFVQLVVDGSSDTIVITENEMLPPVAATSINSRLIIGSLDNKTFFNIKAECNVELCRITSGILSQCHMDINGHLESGYTRGHLNTAIYRTTVVAFSVEQIHRVIESKLTIDDHVYNAYYMATCIIYDSVITAKRVYLYAEAVIKSRITSKDVESRKFQISYLIDSNCELVCQHRNVQLLIHTIYKSNLNIVEGYFNDVHYIIDSTISIETNSINAIRLWGGWDEPMFASSDIEAIISNSELRFTKNAYNHEAWSAIACCIGVSTSKIVVDRFSCVIDIVQTYDYTSEVENHWYCVFPQNNHIPSGCKIIKGKITHTELDCYRY